jgi:ketosteroid isomerase-like protein
MHTPSPDLEELRSLNARFIHNFVTNDVRSHDAITHPRFLYLSGSGARIGRSAYLHDWATGFDPAVLPYWDLRDEHIDVFGDVALVRASNKYIQRSGGLEVTRMATYTDVYVRESGSWLCVQAQITEVAPQHWPADDTMVCCYIDGVRQPAASCDVSTPRT